MEECGVLIGFLTVFRYLTQIWRSVRFDGLFCSSRVVSKQELRHHCQCFVTDVLLRCRKGLSKCNFLSGKDVETMNRFFFTCHVVP